MASYKRVLAFLTAILMIVCLFPVPAFAAGPEDEGVNANEGEVLSNDNETPVKEPTVHWNPFFQTISMNS